MKINILLLLFAGCSLTGCYSGDDPASNEQFPIDTISPVMTLVGRANDTAYLHADYNDPGVTLLGYINGQLRCSESISLEVTGSINNRLPGAYVLTYNATDAEGDHTLPLTRTVTVVENSAGFLSGSYAVACTCTAITTPGTQTITSNNYAAAVSPGDKNNRFKVVGLDVGREKLVPYTALNGNLIEGDFWNSDYASSMITGTLSPSKTSFTIESTAHTYSPKMVYKCKNVYTKQLTINK